MSTYSNTFVDVINADYITTSITVGTTAVHAKVGASNLLGRQELHLYNRSANRIFIGPSGVTTTTGIPLEPDEVISLQYGDKIDVYLIAESAGNTVVVQEAG